MIDLQNVQVDVLTSQNQNVGEMTAEENQLLEAVHEQLISLPDFQTLYPSAHLTQVEIQRDHSLTEQGKVYLRFEVPGKVPQEFWGRSGKTAKVNLPTGKTTVVLKESS